LLRYFRKLHYLSLTLANKFLVSFSWNSSTAQISSHWRTKTYARERNEYVLRIYTKYCCSSLETTRYPNYPV